MMSIFCLLVEYICNKQCRRYLSEKGAGESFFEVELKNKAGFLKTYIFLMKKYQISPQKGGCRTAPPTPPLPTTMKYNLKTCIAAGSTTLRPLVYP